MTVLNNREPAAEDIKSHCGNIQTSKFVLSMMDGSVERMKKLDKIDPFALFEQSCDDIAGTMHACAFSNMPDGAIGKQDYI